MKTSYITTPIYYVNDKPHIGHWYTSIASDVIHRSLFLSGFDAKMQTGTDEHGQKIQKSAENNKQNEMQFCNIVSNEFRKMTVFANCACSYEEFNIKNFNNFIESIKKFDEDSKKLFQNGSNFIRTTEGRDFDTGEITDKSLKSGRHIKCVIKLWNDLRENGFIYKGKYSGWYAIRDEAFYTDSELIDNKAPTGAEVEWREEDCYFFKLSIFQKILISILIYNKDFIKPQEKYTEVLSFVAGMRFQDAQNGNFKDGVLLDLCISRPSLKWGIPVPNEDNQSIYVWLDALTNYISALDVDYSKFWENRTKDSIVSHIVGKDILRFHSVYWPAFLLARNFKIDEIEFLNTKNLQEIYEAMEDQLNILPNNIYAHGWWTNNGEKISKSLGNAINPFDEIAKIQESGISFDIATDYFRYFLMKAMPFGNDGDYSQMKLISVVNSDLVNNIGNLVQRTSSMIEKYLNNIITLYSKDSIKSLINFDKVENFYIKYDIISAIDVALELSRNANDLIDKAAPWKLAKDEKFNDITQALSPVCINIILIAVILQPICSSISGKILKVFGIQFITFNAIKDILANDVKIIICKESIGICPRI